MKFLCASCQRAMDYVSSQGPEAGSMSVTFGCLTCGDQVALLTNPAETQLLVALGIKIGGRAIPPEPMEVMRETLEQPGSTSGPGDPVWSQAAEQRLSKAPGFVRGMVRRRYDRYARERGIQEIDLQVMEQARRELGMEGM